MGKKKAFIDKKSAQSFRLVPDTREKSERFQPTQKHLEEQQQYGVYFDDDYDYLQHMRAVNEPMKLENVQEEVEKTTIRASGGPSAFPPAPPMFGLVGAMKKPEFFDEDVADVLDSNAENAELLEENFLELAGGVVDDNTFRKTRRADSDEDDDDEDNEEMFDDYDDDELFGEETVVGEIRPERADQRVIDDQFEELMDREYNTEQIGELDGDDYDVGGALEPNAGRLHKLVNDKGKAGPEYDEEMAKQYVRERMRLIEEGVIKEKEEYEIVEVDESSRKRMKWDCESFATQYTNIYNHPTLIKEPRGLSKKALKRFDRQVEEMDIQEESEEEEDDDDKMEDDNESVFSTVSTFRPKGETPEQRKARKAAVKLARKERREEKKANKTMFAEEKRKLAKGRIGQIKARPI